MRDGKTGWNQICNLDNKDPYMWLSVNDETLSVDFFVFKYIVFTCQIEKRNELLVVVLKRIGWLTC